MADVRGRIRTLLAARAQREADAEASAKLAAAMEARVKQRGTLPPDTYAMRAYELRPLAECYPDTFDGQCEAHSASERAAVNRAIMIGLMDDPASMHPGVRALHDALPEEEQEKWKVVRRLLKGQSVSATRIHGAVENVELLDRASRMMFAKLCNERPTYFGGALFYCYSRVELYPARMLGGDVVDAKTFETRIQHRLDAGMQVVWGY